MSGRLVNTGLATSSAEASQPSYLISKTLNRIGELPTNSRPISMIKILIILHQLTTKRYPQSVSERPGRKNTIRSRSSCPSSLSKRV